MSIMSFRSIRSLSVTFVMMDVIDLTDTNVIDY